MKLTENSMRVLERRYLRKDEYGRTIESPEEMLWRVAGWVALAESPDRREYWTNEFYKVMDDLDFLPNSPTLMNAGKEDGQLSACFVLPIEDSMDGIFTTLKNTALIHKSGGGTGFNFSHLRPHGDAVKSTNGVASGPVSFMELFDHTTEIVMQGGMRRGANMGILNCNHPDIVRFVKAKVEENRLTNFNISVGITDSFMKAVKENKDWELINPRNGEIINTVKARDLFNLFVEYAWRTGDPGLIFLDTIQQYNPIKGSVIEASNPCGETPLLPYESCNLGSINLLNFYDSKTNDIDYYRLKDVVKIAVRFLDNIIDVNCYPIPEIERATKATRKIGLGVMGWADLLYKLKIPYNSERALELANKVMCYIREKAHLYSYELAKEKGTFPLFNPDDFPFEVRNATITTIAPTGTISLIAGVSGGIEPNFALAYQRKAFTKEAKGEETLIYINPILLRELKDRGLYSEDLVSKIMEKGSLKDLGVPDDVKQIFVTAHDISPDWHVKMQAAFQKYVDNAVSKTINMPHNATIDDVYNAFMLAYDLGCKGITIFRDGCKSGQVLNVGTKEVVKSKKQDRPSMLNGKTVKISTSYGNLYLTLNVDENGNPFEIFATLGKSGKDTQAHTEAIGRLVSLALRSGISINDVIRQLKGIGGSTQVLDENLFTLILSIPDAIAKGLEMLINGEINNHELIKGDVCPTCGAPLIYEEGCIRCSSCDFSKCG